MVAWLIRMFSRRPKPRKGELSPETKLKLLAVGLAAGPRSALR